MQNFTITVEEIGVTDAVPAAAEVAKKAIYVESEFADLVTCLTIGGAYKRKYYFVTTLTLRDLDRYLLEGDKLIVCLWSEILIFDLPNDKIKKIAVTEGLELYAIYKFKDGYFIHGELFNSYFDRDFDFKWEADGRDIFFCPTREKSLEIYADHIDVWDFLGYKYTYDEFGELDSFERRYLKFLKDQKKD